MQNTRFTIIILTFILVFSSRDILAQKCKYSFDESDPMTEERVRRAENKLKGYFIVSYYRKGDDFRVELNVRYVGERNFIVAEGTEMSLKAGGGEILKFSAAQKATPVSYVSDSQVMTIYAVTYHCSKEQMEKLGKEGFKVASTQIGDETVTLEVKAKDIEGTAFKARCMLSD